MAFGKIGSYEPVISKSKLAVVGFTAVGYQIYETNTEDLKWLWIRSANLPSHNLPGLGISTLTRDTTTDLLAKVQLEPLSVTKYSKTYHLFNFHSIIPDH